MKVRDPKDVREHLSSGAGDDAVLASITATYFFLRRGLAALAFAFPLVLLLRAGWPEPASSLSAFYHYDPAYSAAHGGLPAPYGSGEARNFFVGVLWTVGAFLILYKGYGKREDWVLNIAGLAAILVSLFPMDWPSGEARTLSGDVHYASALVFFFGIGYVCSFRSRDTLDLLDDPSARARFRNLYRLFGTLMWAAPLAVVLLHLLSPAGAHSRFIFWAEVVAVWVFGAFWFTKSREIAAIERQRDARAARVGAGEA